MKFLASILLMVAVLPAFAFDHGHSKWTEVLKKYQNPQGLVAYKKLKADSADKGHMFNAYLSDIQSVSFKEYEGWAPNEKKAFLINSYNSLTVKLIVDHYPVKSIKKIGGFFTKPWSVEFFSLLNGKIKSLDPIEHEWLRPQFKDYRIHAAVNCASISCPPLRREAFVGKKIDAQLDDQMLKWLADKSRNEISSKEKVFTVSKIFDWYEKDFVEWGGGVVNVISKYMKKPMARDVANQVKLKYLDYNWDLNEAK